MNPTATTLHLMEKRGITICQCCGERPAEESHHCLYGKRKGVKKLNDEENLQAVCRSCHKRTGKALTFENRLNYWNWACDHYGKDHMIAWHERLSLKVKEKAYR